MESVRTQKSVLVGVTTSDINDYGSIPVEDLVFVRADIPGPSQIDANFAEHDGKIEALKQRIMDTRAVADGCARRVQNELGDTGRAGDVYETIRKLDKRVALLEAAKPGDGEEPVPAYLHRVMLKRAIKDTRASERQRAAEIVREYLDRRGLYRNGEPAWMRGEELLSQILDGAENNTPDVTVQKSGYENHIVDANLPMFCACCGSAIYGSFARGAWPGEEEKVLCVSCYLSCRTMFPLAR